MAFMAYLEGKQLLLNRSPLNLPPAVEKLTQATRMDPEYAHAWAALARALSLAGRYRPDADYRGLFDEAWEAAQTAVALAPELVDGRVEVAALLRDYRYDWQGAEREFLSALGLAPEDAYAQFQYADFLESQGRHAEALEYARRAVAREPSSADRRHGFALRLFRADSVDASIREYQTATALDASFPVSWQNLGLIYVMESRWEEASTSWQRWAELSGLPTEMAVGLIDRIRSYRESGVVAPLPEAFFSAIPLNPVYRATVHVLIGESEEAIDWLWTAYEDRSPDMFSIAVRPEFAALREHTRFLELLRAMGLQ